MDDFATVPSFPSLRDLSLNDRKFMDNILNEEQPQISELSFANLFMWRESEPTQLSRVDGSLLIQYKSQNGSLMLLPPLGKQPLSEVLRKLKQTAGRTTPMHILYGIGGRDAEELSSLRIRFEPCRDDWDYVYLTRDLADLPGDKYHAKRNLISRCLSKHKCEYSGITAPIIDECLQLQTKWCNLHNCNEKPSLAAENRAIKQLFEHYGDLSVFGGVIYVDGNLEAFTVAERLNNETAVVHVEKANPEIIGLYQVINQWFCQNALKGFEFVNREQDMGISGLRRAKTSYHPHHMVEKYKAFLT